MKHDIKVTLFLVFIFLVSQLIGLAILSKEANVEKGPDGSVSVEYPETSLGRPELEGSNSFYYIVVMIVIGTALNLLIIRLRLFKVWKAWFYLAVLGVLYISFSVFIPELIALAAALVLAYLKLFRPNLLVHNFTEIFMYPGLAFMIVPMFSLYWSVLLLVAISIYDAIAVWQSKHMITLAKAQAESRMFAGILIPYTLDKKPKIKAEIPKGIEEKKTKSAILGGGDIAFPLIFAGSVLTWLIEKGLSVNYAFLLSLLVPLFSGVALLALLLKSSKNKFYPAMPFISLGCFIGFGIILLFPLN